MALVGISLDEAFRFRVHVRVRPPLVKFQEHLSPLSVRCLSETDVSVSARSQATTATTFVGAATAMPNRGGGGGGPPLPVLASTASSRLAASSMATTPQHHHHQVLLQENRFSFDSALDTSCTQTDVYEETFLDLLDSALRGDNVGFICYGPTGSGKTFSMVGEWDSHDASTMGILPRAATQILSRMKASSSSHPTAVAMSKKMETAPLPSAPQDPVKLTLFAAELYLEELRDLFPPPPPSSTAAAAATRRATAVAAASPSSSGNSGATRKPLSTTSSTALSNYNNSSNRLAGTTRSTLSASTTTTTTASSSSSLHLLQSVVRHTHESAHSILAPLVASSSSSAGATRSHTTTTMTSPLASPRHSPRPRSTSPLSFSPLSSSFSGRSVIKFGDQGGLIELCSQLHGQEVASLEALHSCYKTLAECRVTAGTALNDKSSRSHALFILRIDFEGSSSPSFVTMVDLAGSERVKQSQVEGIALLEAQSINKSLSALCTVVHALHERQQHVPYRDSKLTRLLRPCLESGLVAVLLHAVPTQEHRDETISTLKFAERLMHTRVPMAATTSTSTATGGATSRGFLAREAVVEEQLETQSLHAFATVYHLACDLRIANAAYGFLPRRLSALTPNVLKERLPVWHNHWRHAKHDQTIIDEMHRDLVARAVEQSAKPFEEKARLLREALHHEQRLLANLTEVVSDGGSSTNISEATIIQEGRHVIKVKRQRMAAVQAVRALRDRLSLCDEWLLDLGGREETLVKQNRSQSGAAAHISAAAEKKCLDDDTDALQHETRNSYMLRGVCKDALSIASLRVLLLSTRLSRLGARRLCLEAQNHGYGILTTLTPTTNQPLAATHSATTAEQHQQHSPPRVRWPMAPSNWHPRPLTLCSNNDNIAMKGKKSDLGEIMPRPSLIGVYKDVNARQQVAKYRLEHECIDVCVLSRTRVVSMTPSLVAATSSPSAHDFSNRDPHQRGNSVSSGRVTTAIMETVTETFRSAIITTPPHGLLSHNGKGNTTRDSVALGKLHLGIHRDDGQVTLTLTAVVAQPQEASPQQTQMVVNNNIINNLAVADRRRRQEEEEEEEEDDDKDNLTQALSDCPRRFVDTIDLSPQHLLSHRHILIGVRVLTDPSALQRHLLRIRVLHSRTQLEYEIIFEFRKAEELEVVLFAMDAISEEVAKKKQEEEAQLVAAAREEEEDEVKREGQQQQHPNGVSVDTTRTEVSLPPLHRADPTSNLSQQLCERQRIMTATLKAASALSKLVGEDSEEVVVATERGSDNSRFVKEWMSQVDAYRHQQKKHDDGIGKNLAEEKTSTLDSSSSAAAAAKGSQQDGSVSIGDIRCLANPCGLNVVQLERIIG